MVDRTFDYSQRVLVAVEFGPEPRRLEGPPNGYSVFRRLPMRELVAAAGGAPPPGSDFERVMREHMGYWEQRIPAGQQCFVHYAIGAPAQLDSLFHRMQAGAAGWALLGAYHLEPQSSCYPFGFPSRPVPDNARLGETKAYTDESVFWFNFFPPQDYLFEKTFAIWTRFCSSTADERGECNQLVAGERVEARGVDEFVQVNLNRFSSLRGFFASARGAGENTFTVDADYRWYGMLLRKIA
jgi:hypothetical protein